MSKDARVSWFTFWTFIFAGCYCWSLLQSWFVSDARWLAMSFAAIAAIAMLLDRKRQHDELCEPRIAPTTPQQPKKPETEIRPQVQSNNGNVIRFARFSLTSKQWARLAVEIYRADKKVTRDIVARAKVFKNITANGKWAGILGDFERLGWVSSGELTEDGEGWFGQFITPPPHS